MRWQHIKTVMIAILLVVNLWLGGLLINRNLTQNYLDKDVLQNTVEILGRDGILLSVDQLDAGRRTADLFSAPLPEDYNMAVVDILASSEITDVFPIPAGGTRVLTASGGSLSFDGNFGVTYLPVEVVRNTLESICAQVLADGTEISPTSFSLRDIRQYLEQLLSSAVDEHENVPAKAKVAFVFGRRLGEYTLLRCRQEVDGRELVGHTVDCLFDQNGNLLYLDGTWSFLSLSGSYSAPLYDQINILFIEKAAIDEMRDRGEIQENLKLASLELCYVLCQAETADSRGDGIYYAPAWYIRYTDGTEHIYNAITGTPITLSAST